MSMKPIPRSDANSSPTSVPKSASETPMRMPEKISGSAAGSSTVRTVCAGVSRITRARTDVAHAVHRENDDRKDAVDGAERDFGREAEPEEHQDHRVERDLRNRGERVENRIEHVAGEAREPEQQTDREAAAERERH